MMGVSELEIIRFRFNRIYQSRPRALRSTFLHGPVGWMMRIFGWISIVAGLGIIVAGFVDTKIFQEFIKFEDVFFTSFMLWLIIGFLLIVLGVALLFISSLCRKLVHRNLYILDMEDLLREERQF